MKLKPGDIVRFLNESIEGKVNRILTNDRVEVLDSHGFSHISLEKNLVLIELVLDESQLMDSKEKLNTPELNKFPAPGNSVSNIIQSLELDQTIYAAVRLMDEKSPLTTDVELILINNTQFYICYTVSRKHQDLRSGLGSGQMPSRGEKFIGIFSQDELHRFDGFEFQFLFFDNNEFKPRPPAIKSLQFNSSDFMDLNYRKLYYKKDDTVLLMPLYNCESDEYVDISKLIDRYKQSAEEEEKRNALRKGKTKQEKFTVLTRQKVVDLHIEELMKEHSEMSGSQIISYQLNYFIYEMDQAILNKLHKITFIHGVGNGVLRSSIREELKRLPNIRYNDAPPEKYGYGATEVEFI